MTNVADFNVRKTFQQHGRGISNNPKELQTPAEM
jgi:hypothetical protein